MCKVMGLAPTSRASRIVHLNMRGAHSRFVDTIQLSPAHINSNSQSS